MSRHLRYLLRNNTARVRGPSRPKLAHDSTFARRAALAVLTVLALLGLPSNNAHSAEPFRFTGGSALPLLIIDTHGKPIPDEPKREASLQIIARGNGQLNRLTDEPTASHRIGIEIRGASSQMFDKKSYAVETRTKKGKDKDVSLLGLPPESDWILYGPHSDKSLIRNYLAYDISNQMGQYAPRMRFAEVFLRDSNKRPLAQQYVGVYLIAEKIKRGKDRVDVPRLAKRKGQLSGGYIVKVDRVDGPESYFTSELGSVLGHVSPRGDRLGDARRAWIRQDFSRIEQALAGTNFLDPQTGYSQHLDTGSFIDFFILNELFKNVDAYFLSTFLHRTGDGKLRMGPIWDFNLSTGNASYGGVWKTEDWVLLSKSPSRAAGVPFWWDRLFEDPRFVAQLIARWKTLRQDTLATAKLIGVVDRTARRLDAAQQRNFRRWRILGNYVWPNPRPYAKTYDEEIQRLKQWLSARLKWIDVHIEKLEVARQR